MKNDGNHNGHPRSDDTLDSRVGPFPFEFEVVPIQAQFRCSHAVYRKENGTSVCYVTNPTAGDLIVKALEKYLNSGYGKLWLKENGVDVPNREMSGP